MEKQRKRAEKLADRVARNAEKKIVKDDEPFSDGEPRPQPSQDYDD